MVDIWVLVPWPITTSWYLALWMRLWQCPWAFVSSVNLNWTKQKTIGNLIVMLWGGESHHRFLSTLPFRKKMFFIECEALARFFNTKGSRSLKCDFPPASWEGVSVNCQVFAKPSGISQNHWAFSRLSSVEGALRQATPHFPLWGSYPTNLIGS